VSRPPDDRGGELRALFLRAPTRSSRPSMRRARARGSSSDEEVIRRIRRAIHTLKGDSAACGFHKLSELATNWKTC